MSVDDEIIRLARERAAAMGTSVNQLVREYLTELSGKSEANALADEFVRLSRESTGNSEGWKFNREEIYQRGAKAIA